MIHAADKTLKASWRERFLALPPEARAALKDALMELHSDAARRAEHSWRKRKGPLALYWRTVSVYSGHIARAIKL